MKMKTNIFAAALMIITGTAFADVTTSNATSGSMSGSASVNAGNAQNITFNDAPIPTDTKQTIKNVPTAVAPSLTTTLTDTCMGSSSGGFSVAGFGVSGGSTWRDDECVNRLNARELKALGDADAAREVMCENAVVRVAYMRAGKPCAADRGTPEKRAQAQATMQTASAATAEQPVKLAAPTDTNTYQSSSVTFVGNEVVTAPNGDKFIKRNGEWIPVTFKQQ